MATTANFGWEIPDVDEDFDTWGDIQTTLFNAIDAQLKAVKNTADAAAVAATINALVTAAAPTGKEDRFYLATAPAGWVAANGGTIGSAASGATTRAHADTQALFTALWGALSNADFPIQDSAGSASTRGASAAADFAANKRFPLPDRRGEGDRGWDNGRGVDPGRTLGSSQLDAVQGFYMSLPGLRQGGSGASFAGSGAGDNPTLINQTGGPIDDGTHGVPRIASETRGRNVAALICIKL
ncbi:hypothetical protein [Caulobacter rhizosphaerae]|uniref:hypothetical protein n=1 Tax=Caulobacter rhizosphaerae TaxID=2010972 RepID=UPI0013D0E9F2|nr:hypothetical protein [Caulobacter rhizosphaerae]GGL48460.1 hypothetical protein GCM10010983_52260 [Caulobacter rhizosphaerae]